MAAIITENSRPRNELALWWQFYRWFETDNMDWDTLVVAFRHLVDIGAFTDRYRWRDNFRVADLSDPGQVQEYTRRRNDTTYGPNSYDEPMYINSKPHMVGFNYYQRS